MNKKANIRQLLQEAADFIDKKYATNRQLANFTDYINHHEFEPALDSLLELANEVEDHFDYRFWLCLKQAANKMKLASYEKIIEQKISEYWYENAKRFSLNSPEIEAKVRYLTEIEGGRSGVVYSGYRGTFVYKGQYNSAAQEFIGQVKCEPGETVTTYISFAAPQAQFGRLYIGLEFAIAEGYKVVGTGCITKIIRSDLAKN